MLTPRRRSVAIAALLTAAWSAPSPAEEPPGTSALHVDLSPELTWVGESFDTRLQVFTDSPLRVFALRIETAPELVRIRSWSFGEGIARHIALHGEPPACDIIVYPDGSRLFAVMVMDPPFSSDEYGSEALVLDLAVEAESPVATCLFYSGDTPDYEPGDDLGSVIRSMDPARSCAPVLVLSSPRIRRGDADGDGRRDLSDAVRILQRLFASAAELDCADAADANDDGRVDVSDCVYLLRALFLGTEEALPDCGVDRVQDSLPPCERPSC